jgi:hypothetical protein
MSLYPATASKDNSTERLPKYSFCFNNIVDHSIENKIMKWQYA